MRTLFRARARLRRPRADGARTSATTARSTGRHDAQVARAQRRRHRAPVERLPPPPGDHAQGPRQRAGHRLPAPSLDLRPQGRAARRAAVRGQALPRASRARRCRTGTACCSTARATSRRTSRASAPSALDFSGYVLDRVETARVRLQLEDLHRGLPRGLPRRPVPPGARQVRHRATTCKWEFGDWSVVQTVGVNAGLAKAGHEDLRALARGGARLLPRRDAAARRDLAHLLPERDGRVVSARARDQHALSRAASSRTLNVVEFYYPEEIALFEREFVEAEQAAYHETALEDDEIGERMDAGRKRAAARRAAARSGPYQSPMEDGMQHFHEFFRREMERELASPEA